jgi:hypothetical protein
MAKLNEAIVAGRMNDLSPTVRFGIHPNPSMLIEANVCRASV